MDDIFNGNTKFVTLESVENFDKTALQERRIQRKVRNFYRVELIPKNVYEKIRPIESQRPWLCGFPKIHKYNIPL